MKILLVVLFLLFLKPSFAFKDCILLFEKERFLKSERCFEKIDRKELLYPYALYYILQSRAILDMDSSDIEKELSDYEDFAITHYSYLFLAKKYLKINPKKSLFYIQKVDLKAIDKRDIPFFLYLKASILEKNGYFEEAEKIKKELALLYPDDRFYGYKTARKILPILVDEEIYRVIDNLLKKKMVKRASYFLFYTDDNDKKIYYKIKILSRLGKKKTVKKLLGKIDKDSKYYPKILPYKISYAYKKEEKADYIKELKKLGYSSLANSIARGYMRLSFYRKNMKDFKFFSSLIDENSSAYSDKVWYTFLSMYRDKRYFDAATYLEEHKDIFNKEEKNKIYYWLYLSFSHFEKGEAKRYLKKAAFSDYIDFYKILAQKKLRIKKVSLKIYKPFTGKVRLEKKHYLIKALKDIGLYRYAYLEAAYLLKNSKNLDDYLKLSLVFPEKTARYFSYKTHITSKAYPKPFHHIDNDDLIYAFMRQESFFDAYILSTSNAVGLMQIIPSTARWIAKKIRDEDFSISKLFNPEKNIKYGKWYINYLLKKFEGNLFYAIAAYNGGGRVVRRIIKYNHINDIAEFVEYIPYLQTKKYVKKVYTNYFIYRALRKKRYRYVYRSD